MRRSPGHRSFRISIEMLTPVADEKLGESVRTGIVAVLLPQSEMTEYPPQPIRTRHATWGTRKKTVYSYRIDQLK